MDLTIKNRDMYSVFYFFLFGLFDNIIQTCQNEMIFFSNNLIYYYMLSRNNQ